MKVLENDKYKTLSSERYNFVFNKKTGFFARWGRTKEDDPVYSPYSCEIVDLEVSTICSKGCKFCYKGNTAKGKNMSFEVFKRIIDKLSDDKVACQIALGIGSIDACPELWKMMEYSRAKGIIPNITVNGEGITDEIADKLVSLCGAVAVSMYDKGKTYDTVKKLTDKGLKQVNIHFMLCEETYSQCIDLFYDSISDSRLKNLNAIVLLSLKQKGRAAIRMMSTPWDVDFHSLNQLDFAALVDLAKDKNIPIGFDSCSCHKFLKAIEKYPDVKSLAMVAEPCESGLFSAYFNVDGKFFPCSFAEGTKGWEEGLNVEEFWGNSKIVKWRETLIKCGRVCPLYKI